MARRGVWRRQSRVVGRLGRLGAPVPSQDRSGRPRPGGGGPKPSSPPTTRSSASSKVCVRSVAIEPGPITRQAAASHRHDDARRACRSSRIASVVGVLYGRSRHVIGVDLDVLVVLGMAEGVLPADGRRQLGAVRSSERAAIASPFAVRQRARDERRTYLAALASAGRRWLITPRVGPDRVAYPAPWWSDAPHEHELTIDSFDSELAKPIGPAASLHERDLRVLRQCPRAVLSDDPLVAVATAARSWVHRARRSG